MKTKVINFYGGPGSGKSTKAAGLYYKMNMAGYSVELVNEFAKECVWEDNVPMLKDQLYMLAHQHRKILRLVDKVDYVITDSPVLLSGIYRELYDGALYSDLIDQLALECYNKYNNINFMLDRPKFFKQIGRAQDKEGSINIDHAILEQFHTLNIPFFYLKDLTDNAVDVAFEYVQSRARRGK
jgi:thymidylate kinase